MILGLSSSNGSLTSLIRKVKSGLDVVSAMLSYMYWKSSQTFINLEHYQEYKMHTFKI